MDKYPDQFTLWQPGKLVTPDVTRKLNTNRKVNMFLSDIYRIDALLVANIVKHNSQKIRRNLKKKL